jgi:uncharacterized membrane protein YciS (DUF1049 family)
MKRQRSCINWSDLLAYLIVIPLMIGICIGGLYVKTRIITCAVQEQLK